MPSHQREPTLIPLPEDFPVTWDPPELINLTFKLDKMHAPDPITPMTGWLGEHPFAEGSSSGFQNSGRPRNLTVGRFNTYYYFAASPSLPSQEMEAAAPAMKAVLEELVGGFVLRWEEEWLPEVKAILRFWSEFTLQQASDEELLRHMEESILKYRRLFEIHMSIGFSVPPSRFVDFYNDLFEPSGPLEAYRLILTDHNMSLEVDEALYDLARKYAGDPSIAGPVRTKSPNAALSGFVGTVAGREFLRDLREFLDRYGHRSDGVLEIGDPSWTEDPAPALTSLREYVKADAVDPRVKHREQLRERDEATEAARVRIASYPQPVRDRFEELLAASRAGQMIQEDHNFWMDQQGLHFMRHMFLEFGRRLVGKGLLDSPNDVFYLVPGQVRDSLMHRADFRALVAAEKAEMAERSRMTPPPMIGTDYGPPPPGPMTGVFGKFFGAEAAPSEEPGTLTGIPVAPGAVTATARVIMSLRDSARLKKGDILVARTTAPPWTPLFAIAGGVVTDTGGPLSHCGIVAREYGIPCVGGTGDGSTTIRDGATIEVDGDAGTVRILDGT